MRVIIKLLCCMDIVAAMLKFGLSVTSDIANDVRSERMGGKKAVSENKPVVSK